MTLPLRTGLRVTRFAVNTTLSASMRAIALANDAVQTLTGHGGGPAEAETPPSDTPSRSAETETQQQPRPRQTQPRQPRSRPTNGARSEAPEAPAPDATPSNEQPTANEPRPVVEDPTPVVEEPTPLVEEPAHVSEEPVLVEEVAEPGAEDGAGASITIDEPWKGYGRLGAKDIIDRLSGMDAAELAAIQLYEGTHKRRETVLTAVQRELRVENARPNRPH